jgi:branched-chain amino acid transport system ATP-binding protein
MLRISNLDVSIQSIDILRGVNLTLEKGQMAGLVGRNGAGKTTFIKSVMGLLKASAPDSAQRLQYVYGIIPELVDFAQRRGSQLSGGQQKLVALGRALMTGRQLLLLDEPFEGVAPALAQRLAEVISGLKSEGMAVIFSESDLQYSQSLVQKIFVMDRGTLTETSAIATA